MLKGFLAGSFLSNAASAGAEADNARAAAARSRNAANLAMDTAEVAMAGQAKIVAAAVGLMDRLDQIREDLLGSALNSNNFRLDDASLRALLRDLLAAIREASPNHPFLDKANRDRVYGAAFEDAFLSAQNTGWATQIGNQKALESLIGIGTGALREVAPEHRLLDADERSLVYWEAFENESVKLSKVEDDACPGMGIWNPRSISQTNAIGSAAINKNRPYGWVPKKERGEWLEAQREKVGRKAGMRKS